MKNKSTTVWALILSSICVTATAGDITGSWLDVYRKPAVSARANSLPGGIGPKRNYRGAKFLKSSQLVQTLSRKTITMARQVAALSFFENPVILPDGNSILSYSSFGEAKQDVSLYKINYRSITVQGKPTILSGLVVIPTDGTGGDASGGIIVYMHATTAQRDNAPSDRSEETYGSITAFGGETRIIAMPDYLGYGVNKLQHPYAFGKLNAPSGRDIILATRELMKALGRTVGAEINISGFSEGGGNALWLGRFLEEQGNTALQPARIAPISGPYDLSGATALSFISAQPPATYEENFTSKPSLLSFAGVSTAQLTKQPLNTLLKEPLALQAKGLFPGPIADETVGVRILTTCIDQLNYFDLSTSLSPNPENLLQPSLVEAIKQHDVTNPAIKLWSANDDVDWTPKAPVLLLGVIQDELVPYAASSYPLPPAYINLNGLPAPYAAGNAENVIAAMRQKGIGPDKASWVGFNGVVKGGVGGLGAVTMDHAGGFLPSVMLAASFFEGKPLKDFPPLSNP